jgi:hypothetical protein
MGESEDFEVVAAQLYLAVSRLWCASTGEGRNEANPWPEDSLDDDRVMLNYGFALL